MKPMSMALLRADSFTSRLRPPERGNAKINEFNPFGFAEKKMTLPVKTP